MEFTEVRRLVIVAMFSDEALQNSLEQMRRQAEAMDQKQGRKFRVEISKFEYCEGKIPAELDGRTPHRGPETSTTSTRP